MTEEADATKESALQAVSKMVAHCHEVHDKMLKLMEERDWLFRECMSLQTELGQTRSELHGANRDRESFKALAGQLIEERDDLKRQIAAIKEKVGHD